MVRFFFLIVLLAVLVAVGCKKDEYPGQVSFTLDGSAVEYANKGEKYAYFVAESSGKISIFADDGKLDGSRLVIELPEYIGVNTYKGKEKVSVSYWKNVSNYYELYKIYRDSFTVAVDEVQDEYITGRFSGIIYYKKQQAVISNGAFVVYRNTY